MKINLDKLGLDELKKLQKDVAVAISSFEDRRKKDALAAMEKAAGEFGLTVKDVLGAKKRGSAAKVPGVAKYRNPADKSQTWTGKGRRPAWFIAAIESGKSEKSLKI